MIKMNKIYIFSILFLVLFSTMTSANSIRIENLEALSTAPLDEHKSQNPPPLQLAVTCFKSGEQTSGQNKICFYDCLGSRAAITIKSFQLCPLNINR